MAYKVIFFKTIQKTNVVFLENPSKRRILQKSGANIGKVKQIQPIMFCKDHDTIIVEELKKIDATLKPTSLSTRKGTFRVQEDDIYLLEYLRASAQNEANGGKLFKEIDVAQEDAFQLEGYAAFDKAINAVMQADKAQAKALALTFISPSAVHNSVQNIKLSLRRSLALDDKLVEKVNNFMDEKISEERLLIATALTGKIIALHEGRKFLWAQSKEVFYTASQAGAAVDELALWLKNDKEGRQYLKALSDKVAELKD